MKTFELKKEHLKLLSSMYVGWQDMESGAPEIDPKRPYGDSNVPRSIHFILTGEDGDDLYESIETEYWKLHEETETALQIILATMSFQVGTYQLEGYGRDWKLI